MENRGNGYLNFKRLSSRKPMTHRIDWRPVWPPMHSAMWRFASLIVPVEGMSVLLDWVTDSGLSE